MSQICNQLMAHLGDEWETSEQRLQTIVEPTSKRVAELAQE